MPKGASAPVEMEYAPCSGVPLHDHSEKISKASPDTSYGIGASTEARSVTDRAGFEAFGGLADGETSGGGCRPADTGSVPRY
jgi:hypothetical protein